MSPSPEQVEEWLKDKLSQLAQLQPSASDDGSWIHWHQDMRSILRHSFGPDSIELQTYDKLTIWYPAIGSADQLNRDTLIQWGRITKGADAYLRTLLTQVERFGLPVSASASTQQDRPPNVFVAHGGDSKSLALMVDFLTAMGCRPVIAEKMSSEGRSVNENVEYWMGESDCAVVLATGDELAGGQVVARPNVHIEIGRFQERFPHRIVYLLEEGAVLPSNVSEKVYARFTQDNMTKAFIKVVTELRAFGF